MEVSLVDHPCIPSATFEVVKADGSIELRKFKRSTAERDVSRDAAEFADPGYLKDRKKRCPLDTEAHIRAAWGYFHHPKNQAPYTADQLAQIKARIVAAWKAKIDKKGPPLAAGKNSGASILAKNLGDVSQLALIIDDLSQIATELDDPSIGDGSLGSLKTTIESLVALLNSLVDQATSGLTSNDSSDTDDNGADTASASGDQTAADAEDDEDSSDDTGAYDEDDDDDAFADKLARGALTKALAVVTPRIDAMAARVADLTKRLEHLESQPLPGGPVTKFVTVTKSQDMAGRDTAPFPADPLADFQRHLEQLAPGARAHLLTKLALRNPL
jgi:hypothetical protein